MTSMELGRAIVRGAFVSALPASLMTSSVLAQDIDLSKWSPEYVRSIAGTEEFDTVGHCNSVTPTDYKASVEAPRWSIPGGGFALNVPMSATLTP